MPRRDRDKPGCDEYDVSNPGLTGEAGTYGCLAIDNLYNVMHETDGELFESRSYQSSVVLNMYI